MSTFYVWDEAGRAAGTIECDPAGPLPERCTSTPPPAGLEHPAWIGGAWVEAPQPDLASLQAELRQRVTALRWQHETGGISVGDMHILTGINDQNRIASVLVAAPASVDFKGTDGWTTLTLAELQGIAALIAAHVQQCFSNERFHHEAIAALTTVEEALSYNIYTGWPT